MHRVSIVICTLDRAQLLRKTLTSLDFIRYEAFEVVVVYGPCSDETINILREFEGKIKIRSNPDRNLAKSRNIGIAASSGDIVAFIDDDAIPEPNWLSNLVVPFEGSADVGCVGGYIRDNGGYEFQAKTTLADRFGRHWQYDSVEQIPLEYFNVGLFLSTTGTNCAFSMDALKAASGFCEEFAYYLDETDLNLRVSDLGYNTVIVPAAEIHHKYAESHIRTSDSIPKNMFPIAKSIAFFTMTHGRKYYGLAAATEYLEWYLEDEKKHKANNVVLGDITIREHRKLIEQVRQGIQSGVERAEQKRGVAYGGVTEYEGCEFKTFSQTKSAKHRLRVCFLSQDHAKSYPGGIGRWTLLAAEALADLGHEVSIFGFSEDGSHYVESIRGKVWSHRLPVKSYSELEWVDTLGAPASLADRGRCYFVELNRCMQTRAFEIVSSPIWDVEGCAVMRIPGVKSVVSLHTPAQFVLKDKAEWRENPQYWQFHVEPLINCEKRVMESADAVLANSNAILRDITQAYQTAELSARVVPHGVPDANHIQDHNRAIERTRPTLRVLFVGRLEERKGVDTFVWACEGLLGKGVCIQVDIVGEASTDEGLKHVRWLCNRYPELVTYYGVINDYELEKLYSSADIFVAPSRYESFGLIYLEAMRFSTPCIGCDVGGVPEVVQDGRSGFVIPVDDWRALADRIELYYSDPDLVLRHGREGRVLYEERYTVPEMGRQLEAYYDWVKSGAKEFGR